MDDRYLSVRQLAEYSSLSESTLRGHLGDPALGKIAYHRIRPGGKILVRVSDFEAWMGTKRVAAETALEDPIVREFMEAFGVKVH